MNVTVNVISYKSKTLANGENLIVLRISKNLLDYINPSTENSPRYYPLTIVQEIVVDSINTLSLF